MAGNSLGRWRHELIVPAIWEAETEGSLEPVPGQVG
jgi:hypothetical protein